LKNYRDTDISYMETYTITEKSIFGPYINTIINELTIAINDIYDMSILVLQVQ
jgi:hypothetical protein